ncbi:MAG: TolC family protein [Desulfotignum sp.]|jgi:outer membrane protein TolC|nr:TolC family protein [Desulfotignum sp.]
MQKNISWQKELGFKTVWILVSFFLVSSVQAKELTLEQALGLAEKNATELEVLDAEHALATASFQRSAQAFLPKISIDATLLRADSSLINDIPVPLRSLPPRIGYRDFGPVDGMIRGIQVIQPVFNADASKAREQAKKEVQARRLAYQWGEQMLRFQVAGSYYAVAVRQADERATRMALEAAQQAQNMADGAYQEGLVAKLDVVRAEAEVAAGKARVRTAEAEVHKARINFAVLLGLPPQKHFILTSDLPEPLPPVTEKMPSKKRSDLKAREAEQEAAATGLDKAKARRLPRINLLARQQWFDGDAPFDMYADGWLVALTLQWSLFDGLGRQGEIAEARARKTLARIGVEHTRRTIEKEQQLAISEWRAAWSAWQASVNALEPAEDSVSLAHRRYEEGLGNMTDLLTTQASLYQHRLEYTRYHYKVLLASMNYCLRYGKDPLTVLSGEIR